MTAGIAPLVANQRSANRLSMLILNWRDTGHPDGGGSEVYAEHVVDGLAELGHDVTMFTARYPGSAALERRASGARLMRRGGRRTVYLQALAAFRRGHLGRPDVIVEVHNGMPFLAKLWSGGTPVVVLVHHVHREQWRVIFGPLRARIGWWLESWLAPRVNASVPYVAVSEVTSRELSALGVPAEHIEVIHNGTPTPMPEPIAKSAQPSLLSLGRLVPHKRVEIAIDAVAQLADEFPDVTLTVAGRGWWANELRSYAEDRGLTERVTFAGFVSRAERHRLYSSAWVHLVPSLKEGWGLVVVEAGAHGLPSVAFQGAGGVTESIIDDATGLLARSDDVEDFAAKVRQLIKDGELRERLGRDAKTHASQFSWDTTVKDFDRLLCAVSERNATSSRT